MKVYAWKDSAYPVYGIDVSRMEVEIHDEVQKELGKYSCE